MRRYFSMVVCCLFFLNAKADHISGSELIYEYLGPGSSPNTQKFLFTYRLFRGCNSTSPTLNNESVTLGIYHSGNYSLYTQLPLAYQTTTNISLNTSRISCFTGNLSACYGIGIFKGTIELPVTADGFTASWIRCCRPMDIVNLPSGEIGISPIATIPGSNILGTGYNTSAAFQTNDTSLVCAGKKFQIDFSASDKDGDSLSYRLTNGINWIAQFAYNPPPLTQLNYTPLTFASGFSPTNPTGTSPVLNPLTGILSGMAPAAGRYLFCVAVEEWRNGVKVNEHIKEIPVAVGNCDFVEAMLPEKIINCDSKEVLFENGATSSSIVSYRWIFDTTHPSGNISLQPTPTHQYQDTGTYPVRLVVTGSSGCKDSATTNVLIYPGLKAGFSLAGTCIRYPYLFKDTSSTKGSSITKWNWDFGDAPSVGNNNSAQNPSYIFSSAGNKKIKLIVESAKGCKDSTSYSLTVIDKPTVRLSFRDTVICRTDTIQLHETSGYPVYQWTPALSINKTDIASPRVYPDKTEKYHIKVITAVCDNIDSVTVSVLPKNAIFTGRDTVICKTDPVYLNAVSDAPVILWSGDASIVNKNSLTASAFPGQNIQYIVTANPGRCAISDTVQVKVVAFPLALLPADTTICFGEKVLLPAQVTGSSFSWTPANSLSTGNSISPFAAPSKTTDYILTVTDTLGCPKPVSDTIHITVIPRFNVWAGNDTVVVTGQSLQLKAIASDQSVQQFIWSPTTGLSNPLISNPVAILTFGIDSIQYKVTAYNGACFTEDVLTVKRFAGNSDFYIPTAFTPNGDGVNDTYKIHSAGIARIEFIRIFNRYGQLIFTTADAGTGWNGTFKGIMQPTGSYVFWVKGTDHTGTTIERKGSFVLIR